MSFGFALLGVTFFGGGGGVVDLMTGVLLGVCGGWHVSVFFFHGEVYGFIAGLRRG